MTTFFARPWAVVAAAAVLATTTLTLAGCGPEGFGPEAPPGAEAPSAASPEEGAGRVAGARTGTAPADLDRRGAPEMVITGRVKEVSPDGGAITFDEAVHGVDGVVLAADTEILAASGQQASVREIRPGTVIQTTGSPTGSGTVLASRIRILSGG